MIKKLLVANRGEIAVRVIRAAKELGIPTVAVYSDADKDSMHVNLADEKVCIGPAEPAESYLRIDKILAAASDTGAEAIHPGYGFLSERAEFSESCEKAGVVFVGPPASAMRKLGDKISSKTMAVENGVPITPGFFEPGATFSDLEKAAKKIGYPIMLKASAGGGGRGMRVVREPSDFESACRLASEEALKAFGDGAMMVEKLIERPRHIEVQLLADNHGQIACLYERECSIQRRHQKVIEEAPSPFMTDELWKKMREASLKLARAAGYQNTGTVEFMVDPLTSEFYFLEVNARLQVEHPVTEAITGLDLVQWQIRIASGEKLDIPMKIMGGDRSAIKGWAVEARIISEDPAKGFMPSIGKIIGWAMPLDPGIRVDTGFSIGNEVSRYYDSLIAKTITHEKDRSTAIEKLSDALRDFHILGVSTNIAYVTDVLNSPGFARGEIDTGFLGREFSDWNLGDDIPEELGSLIEFTRAPLQCGKRKRQSRSPAWDNVDGFRVTSK